MTPPSEELPGLFISGILSFIVLWIAIKRGFFTSLRKDAKHPPTFVLLFLAFAIYIALVIVSQNFLLTVINPWKVSLLLFCSNAITLGGLVLFLQAICAPIRRDILLKSESFAPKKDLFWAIIAYCIALPLITFASRLLEGFVDLVFHPPVLPDENAVIFFKSTFHNPLSFTLAIIMIAALAPFIEELLFRGFLQSYLRRFLSPFFAIAASSFCFALFHYSPDQNFANIIIVGSIFVLGCFLGFLYERQGSLLASFFLHSLFNLFSIAGIYFLKE